MHIHAFSFRVKVGQIVTSVRTPRNFGLNMVKNLLTHSMSATD